LSTAFSRGEIETRRPKVRENLKIQGMSNRKQKCHFQKKGNNAVCARMTGAHTTNTCKGDASSRAKRKKKEALSVIGENDEKGGLLRPLN